MLATRLLRATLPTLPPSVLRFFGRLQFRVPLLRPLIRRAALLFASREGVIKYGSGAGLRFDSNGRAGFLLGTSEPQEQQLLARLLKDGDTFYDVGANVGFYSTIAARIVGPSGHVYAFEPFGPSAELARKNARLNGFANVTVIEAAVTSREHTAHLLVGNYLDPAHYRITEDTVGEGISVPAVSLDGYAAHHRVRPPGLIMIDIEGGEVEALKGMLQTVRKHRPAIMCEVHWTGKQFQDLVDFYLRELGYVATTYSEEPLPSVPCRYHALLLPR